MYNKYCGLILNCTLIIVGFFQQTNIANINMIFEEIEEFFLVKLKIKIKNSKTLRFVYLQTIVIFSALIYTEMTNCLMYIGPTIGLSVDRACIVICLTPMMTTAMVECQLFAYFLLMKERLSIINQSIYRYKFNLRSNDIFQEPIEDVNQCIDVKKQIFFITELMRPHKINDKIMKKSHKSSASKLKPLLMTTWRFFKNILQFREHRIFVNNFEEAFKTVVENSNFHSDHNYIDRISSLEIIYTKLYEISDLINNAYGIQTIAIIAVQFITLTTMMYHCTMKVIRILSTELSDVENDETLEEVTSTVMWIAIYMYKLFSLCYCIHATNDEIKMFLLKLLQQRIKFTPYGLFDIDLGLFSMITGAVVTYILILIQFDIAQKN
ncbi:CLUMA_CG017939, isoform A [Clunio marinus]|uniref:Gustatory receptor n=1 Tax=Clunio marinus TaxID=568069 RepID=A0A1J1IXS9_9DIPT|nr:CLUMA_CG017939, isoform A [Clunio marinus]